MVSNTKKQELVEVYFINGKDHERDYVINNTNKTVFVIAQYFAWIKIVRKEIRFIDLQKF